MPRMSPGSIMSLFFRESATGIIKAGPKIQAVDAMMVVSLSILNMADRIA